ncbi:MAG: short-chain dehydrogenase/reductase SDR [Acidimicrobiaceae bacterium]|nr:MAG: short-chain dehydrogenase/reductase SDR [Acidimicrobiaceae bacterium]
MSPPDRRTAVVTGGGKGIGLACARALSAGGFEVVVVGRDERALVASGFVHRACDVTDEAAVRQLFASLDHVDVVVNNAGTSVSAAVHRTSLEDWNSVFASNATSSFLCTRAAIGQMRERNWGRIVNVASTASHVGTPYIAAYAAAKHAVLGLTRVVASELAGTGVTANAVCPTFVRTEMTDRTIANIAARTNRTAADAERTLASASALGRLLEPEEVAAAVAFLCTEDARAINGQSLVLDGGTIQS